MKRSNFTFLFLFALLSFASTTSFAQSGTTSTCIGDVVAQVADDCTLTLTPNDLTTNATTLGAADSVHITSPSTWSGMPFVGGQAAFGAIPAGTYDAELFDAAGDLLCWGSLKVENKNPGGDTSTSTIDICCIDEEDPDFDLDDYFPSTADAVDGCGFPIEDPGPVSYNVTKLDANQGCDTTLYIRETKIKAGNATIAIDTVRVIPIALDSVCKPQGELELDCRVLGLVDDYTPASLAAGYRALYLGGSSNTIARQIEKSNNWVDTLFYPYLKKETVVRYDQNLTCSEKQKFPTGNDVQVVVEDKDGNEIWTLVPEVKFFCVGIASSFVPDGLIGSSACAGFESTIVTDKVVTDTVGITFSTGYVNAASFVDYCAVFDKVAIDDLTEYVKIEKGNTCNINTKCVDMELEGQCGLPMIMRSWSMINWCDKSVMDTAQWISFVDNQGPELDTDPSTKTIDEKVDTFYYNIEPWTCVANIAIQAPGVAGCSDYEWQWNSTEGAVRFDDEGLGWIYGLWPGEHTVTGTVYKCNGTSDAVTYTIYVRDATPPVMISEDQVYASLTYGGPDEDGVAKVYVDAIDAGSHDAGCGEVDACLLLKEEWENPVFMPGRVYYSPFSNRNSVSNSSTFYSGTFGFQLGYAPLQCGDPDRFFYYYTSDKFGNLTLAGSIAANICEDFVKFCCTDLGDNQVALVGSDSNGNTNHSWATVTVEDKSGAGWFCRDYSFDCTMLDAVVPSANKPAFGGIICEGFAVEEVSRLVDEQCGGGFVYITWAAYDADGTEISQRECRYPINDGAGTFRPETIRWPLHYTGERVAATNLECEDLDGDGDVDDILPFNFFVNLPSALECDGEVNDIPLWCEEECSLVAYSYEDQSLAAGDACQKIIRRHTIVDWCSYEPNGGDYADDANDTDADNFELISSWLDGTDCVDCIYPSGTELPTLYYRYDSEAGYDNDGYYTFDQVIKVVDNDRPEIEVVSEYEVAITDGADSKDDDTACSGAGTVTATASDVCMATEADPNSLSWLVQVRVEGSSTVVASNTGVGAEFTMGTQTGNESSVHIITWTVKDACGNTTTTTTRVTFADTKNPTPVCLQDISTATMNVDGSSVAIWASDYDLGSFDNCGVTDVLFGVEGEDGLDFVPSVSFGCADIANGISATQELQLYVFDAQGNYDFCNVTLRIDDNADICEDDDSGAAAIAGEVRTELGDMIESAQVSLNKANTDMTSVEGKYAFGSNPAYTSYSITSKKDDDYLNGVTTLDLVLIQKHVLGIEALDSPYKVIAADINSDANVSAIDLVELRKLILGVYNTLPSNDSWRFVDATETFADANDPFPFTEALNIAELNGDALNQDFLGVKIGDVSGNAIANSLIAAGTRSAGTLNIEIADATVDAGQVISVPVSAANFSDIAAYQFTMDVNGLEFTGVESGAINVTAENFGLIDANTITTAWNSTAGVSASDVLFTMNFRATAGLTLSDAISISSRVTTAAAYTASADQLDVNVSFNGVATTEFALFQNEPNPFENVTRVSFELPEAASATLTVFDVTGKVVSIVRGDFAQGANTITLDKSDLNASGVMYYQLESGEFTATKKMIVIE